MRDVTCSTCGQRVPDGQACPICGSAAAIAEGEPPFQRNPSLDDEALPTILQEYHYSFLRIFAYYLLIAVALVIAIGIGWRFFGR
jgi:hypothetical protein